MTHTAKHTPGPWHLGMKPGPMVYGPQGEQVVPLNLMLDMPEVTANAHLIAAAPGLKNALEDSDALLAELCQYVSTDLQACIVEQRRRNNDLLDAIEGV